MRFVVVVVIFFVVVVGVVVVLILGKEDCQGVVMNEIKIFKVFIYFFFFPLYFQHLISPRIHNNLISLDRAMVK